MGHYIGKERKEEKVDKKSGKYLAKARDSVYEPTASL